MTAPTPGPGHRPRLDEVVLHVGLGKCGTTSVQQFLARNRSRLAADGLLVPTSPGKQRHTDIGFFVKSQAQLDRTVEWQRRGAQDLTEFRREVRRRLVREIRRAGLPRALLTDEDLFSSTPRAVQRAQRLTERIARQVRLVVYLRRQDDHMVSRYQQSVKIGEIARLTEYAARDWAWKYDYLSQLRIWEGVLEPARMVVRRYEPGRFVGGTLFHDFLDAAGVGLRADDLEQVRTYNDSLPADVVEFIRVHNLYRVEREGGVPNLIDNRRLTARLREVAGTGPKLTLPETLLDRFMDQWAASNEAVAREYLHDDRAFRTPRKVDGTTTQQCITADRLELFLDAAEIPGDRRAVLRELAAREAASVTGTAAGTPV